MTPFRPAPRPARWYPADLCIDGGSVMGPYPGEVDWHDRWNGWAVPRFSADTVRLMARDTQAKAAEDPEFEAVHFDEKTGRAEIRYPEYYEYEPEVYEPDADGNYYIGGYNWTWEVGGYRVAKADIRQALAALAEVTDCLRALALQPDDDVVEITGDLYQRLRSGWHRDARRLMDELVY
jgi:hypothetical protein